MGIHLISINNSYYRRFSEAGVLIESGAIAQIPDSIVHRNVMDEIEPSSDYVVFENDSAFLLKLPRRFYPIGTWTYYHSNGQVKAKGEYQIEGTSIDVNDGKEDLETHFQLEIHRIGHWIFYNDQGTILIEKNYPR